MSAACPHDTNDRVRNYLVRVLGEEAVAHAERQCAQKPMRLEPMGDKAKLHKIRVLVHSGTVAPHTAGAILDILGPA